MNNLLANWWRSQKFSTALKQGNERRAKQILQEIEESGAKLSWLEQLFRSKLQTEVSLSEYKRELAKLANRLKLAPDLKKELEQKYTAVTENKKRLIPEKNFIQFIHKNFKLIEHDTNKLQCTGLDKDVFQAFEAELVDFIKTELKKIPENILDTKLQEAITDIEGLKKGLDPEYNFKLSSHVYLMKYFLENVYCAYLTWFLIYQSGLLPQTIKILDIAAGPGTIAYGLALLLESSNGLLGKSEIHISYYSLEKQALLQFRGLQFWRRYIEPKSMATNAYFRFDTTDIFDYPANNKKLPKSFFDFIVISHCFFYESQQRIKSHAVYRQIFQENLVRGGHIILIVQGTKLFKAYNVAKSEDITQEESVIQKFVGELGLKLEWYKYLTSTGKITYTHGADFGKFARENLPKQECMSSLQRQYLGYNFISNYAIDDYVILAKR